MLSAKRAYRVCTSRRGMSLPEILIAASLLLLISAILFDMLVPLLGRSARLDQKQDNLQRGVVLRHHLNMRLKTAQILDVQATRIEFYANDTANTPYGKLNRLGTDEMMAYDESVKLEITTQARADGVWAVERAVGSPDVRRAIWNLGPGGTMTFRVTSPLLEVTVTGTAGRFTSGNWTRRFQLVLPNAQVP